eukprot:scaffold1522_cov340-Prasinococcus_capsulatus_cf.AAC.22
MPTWPGKARDVRPGARAFPARPGARCSDHMANLPQLALATDSCRSAALRVPRQRGWIGPALPGMAKPHQRPRRKRRGRARALHAADRRRMCTLHAAVAVAVVSAVGRQRQRRRLGELSACRRRRRCCAASPPRPASERVGEWVSECEGGRIVTVCVSVSASARARVIGAGGGPGAPELGPRGPFLGPFRGLFGPRPPPPRPAGAPLLRPTLARRRRRLQQQQQRRRGQFDSMMD